MRKQTSVKNSVYPETRKMRGNGSRSLIDCRFSFSRVGNSQRTDSQTASDSGVALVMILLIISLAGFIVVDLTHTSYLDIRSNLIAERSLRAEYYLKSAINFGRGLLILDTTQDTDGQNEPWAPFALGAQRLPIEQLGIDTRGLIMDMVIIPLNTAIPVHELAELKSNPSSSGSAHLNQRELLRDMLVRLIRRVFENSGSDLSNSPDPQYNNENFSPEDMVANLIDYMDQDPDGQSRSYESYGEINYRGREDQFAEDYFPNKPISSLKELANVPGWTDARVSALSPFLYTYSGTTSGSSSSGGRSRPNLKMNINFLKEQIIISVADGLDEAAYNDVNQRRTDLSQDILWDANIYNDLHAILGDQAHNILTGESNYFSIRARVRYGDTSTIMTATVHRDNSGGASGYPTIINQEIY